MDKIWLNENSNNNGRYEACGLKQLIYFLNQIKDYQDLNKYYLILPTGSKKILSKFINISRFNEEVNFQYLSKNIF